MQWKSLFLFYILYISNGMYINWTDFYFSNKVKKRMGKRETLNDIYKHSVWVNTASRILNKSNLVWNATSLTMQLLQIIDYFAIVFNCAEKRTYRVPKVSYQRHSLLFQVLNSQFEKKEGGKRRREGGNE